MDEKTSDDLPESGMTDYSSTQDGEVKLTSKKQYTAMIVDVEDHPWPYVLSMFVAYLLLPIIVPIMIIISKVTKKPVNFLTFYL
jgi:hypothetical protein